MADLALPDVASDALPARVFSGARFAASGIGFTLGHNRLLRWALVPMLVQLALFAALLVLGFTFIDDVTTALGPEPGHWYSFLGGVLKVGLVILLLVVSAITTLLLSSVVCDPFYDVLSEATESILLGRDVGQPFTVASVVGGILRELFATLLRLTIYLTGVIALWIVGLTGVGSILAVPLSLAWTWLFVAIEAFARSQSRHALQGGDRLSATFGHKALALGFGAVGWVLAYIPLTSPFLVVGGTRLYLALAAWDRIPSSLQEDDKKKLRGA